MSNTGLVVTSVALCAASVYALSQRRKAGELPLPPGPKADPIIGHLRYLPSSNEEVVYKRWSDDLASMLFKALEQHSVLTKCIEFRSHHCT